MCGRASIIYCFGVYSNLPCQLFLNGCKAHQASMFLSRLPCCQAFTTCPTLKACKLWSSSPHSTTHPPSCTPRLHQCQHFSLPLAFPSPRSAGAHSSSSLQDTLQDSLVYSNTLSALLAAPLSRSVGANSSSPPSTALPRASPSQDHADLFAQEFTAGGLPLL